MSLPPSASDTARRRAMRVLYADRMVQETALAYGLRNSIAWEGEPALRAGTNRIFGEYEGGMLETTAAERTEYIASVPPTVAPNAPGNLQVFAYYQKLIVAFNRPANVLPESTISYTVTVSPGGFTVSGTSSPIIVNGITNGTTYSVSVVANNAAGTSPATTLGSVNSAYSPTVFTSVGSTTWTAPAYVTSVEYLVVGGGGGGGGGHDTGGGGGGGGGMVLTGSTSAIPGNAYTVQVGAGGAASTNNYSSIDPTQPRETDGGVGGNSMFGEIIALGGNGGLRSRLQTGGSGFRGSAQASNISAATGGSGGGSAGSSAGGSGGGGGGAEEDGTNGVSGAGGSGGAGKSSSISGSPVVYGNGGSGARGNLAVTGTDGAANTGNGANGACGVSPNNARNGGVGGSGIVILRF